MSLRRSQTFVLDAMRNGVTGHGILDGGATLLLPKSEKFDSQAFWHAACTFGMTQAVLVSAMIQRLLAEVKHHPSGSECLALQRIWSVGASLPAALCGKFQEAFGIPTYEVWSPQELCLLTHKLQAHANARAMKMSHLEDVLQST